MGQGTRFWVVLGTTTTTTATTAITTITTEIIEATSDFVMVLRRQVQWECFCVQLARSSVVWNGALTTMPDHEGDLVEESETLWPAALTPRAFGHPV